jgi:nucleotide-binding universal stress UspA family protein
VFRRILVPVHGGPLDRAAIDLAAAVSHKRKSTDIILVYVVEVEQRLALDADLPYQIESGESVLNEASDYAHQVDDPQWKSISTELLQARIAGSAIVDESIERGADAIILATANRRRHGKLTQGDTVPFILNSAPCTVLLVRPSTIDGGIT